jgi:DNA topoisomerase-2
MSEETFFSVGQKTDKQHILDNPDTYIGSVEIVDTHLWVLNDDKSKMIESDFVYIPGLYKLFDEGIVNCSDHVVRMNKHIQDKKENALPVTHIEITIAQDGTITMLNDGNGMDVVQKDGVWLPELVFGHLRTSTNYDKNEKKIVGGKNGFGFKIVLIWSTYGRIETVDHIRGLKYVQEYKNNLDEICSPTITKCKTKPYTKITFKPDYARFGISGLDENFVALLKKRVYDISAITDKSIKVKLNDELVPVKNLQQYVDLYVGDKNTVPRVYEDCGERWEYVVALSPNNEFMQVSFVNGIHTSKGGKHVEYILNQILRKLIDYIEKKKKTKVSACLIKPQIMLFLRCDIENPAFDSQTKDFMNTPSAKFGSKCEVSDKFIEKLAKMGIMETACSLTKFKDLTTAKKTDGTKNKSIRGIPKLTDANWAGGEQSNKCILILCEGDSAKAGILSGLSSEDRNFIGVYPLKGKLLNVRGETVAKIAENKEITEIKKILGLETGKQYNTIADVHSNLRYGKVLFFTDQDLDGSHIKGLGVNLFSCEWEGLLKIPGFIGFMNTPKLKAKKGNVEIKFYNDGEFETWKNSTNMKGWNIKYYKGLGTSTGTEFKEYFRDKKYVDFEFNGNDTIDSIDMVFNKKRADDRKDWLKEYDRKLHLDTSETSVKYEEFINRELIHFSKYDCDRSIPNLMDGLKISQRKILFAAFKRKLVSEIKVAQFAGYVSEHACYHHGEASLNGAIIGMAQNFVGSNNINLLNPNGQFGTRLQGGEDSASERYIFTNLNSLTRYIFPEYDDHVLEYLEDDGKPIEPVYYAPIIPMILVNGAKGIGTGFSTEIMCYNPLQIIEYLKNKLMNVEDDEFEFIPYYEGFTGSITKIADDKVLIRGKYEKIDEDTIMVTELPVGHWTQDFKELLEKLSEPRETKGKGKLPAIVKSYQELWTDSTVNCIIKFVKGQLNELEEAPGEYGCNGLEKLLKLYTTNKTSNMHLFNANEKLKKYEKVEEIIDDYYGVRLSVYDARKKAMIELLEKEVLHLSNMTRYIMEVINNTIDLRNKKTAVVTELLKEKGYNVMDEDENYAYLVKMPMDSVTEENVSKLLRKKQEKETELETLRNTTIHQMWKNELDVLAEKYKQRREMAKIALEKEQQMQSTDTKKKRVVKKAVIRK